MVSHRDLSVTESHCNIAVSQRGEYKINKKRATNRFNPVNTQMASMYVDKDTEGQKRRQRHPNKLINTYLHVQWESFKIIFAVFSVNTMTFEMESILRWKIRLD